MESASKKCHRLIHLFERLNSGEEVNKSDLAREYDVSEKTIQRDFDDLRAYYVETFQDNAIEYDRTRNTYSLEKLDQSWLTNIEVLALSKILLESRAFNKGEMNGLIDKLLLQISSEDRSYVEKLIAKERVSYVELRHGKDLLKLIWTLSEHISNQNEIPEGQEVITFDVEFVLIKYINVNDDAYWVSQYDFDYFTSTFISFRGGSIVGSNSTFGAELYQGGSVRGDVTMLIPEGDQGYLLFEDFVWYALP